MVERWTFKAFHPPHEAEVSKYVRTDFKASSPRLIADGNSSCRWAMAAFEPMSSVVEE